MEKIISKGVEPKVLTKRELEIVKMIAEGWTDRDIADKQLISARTVAAHKTKIYDKVLYAYPNSNAVLLTRWACVNGLVEGMPWT